MTSIVWFRRDLRLQDNPALAAALEQGQPIVFVYCYAPEDEAPWSPGAASRWYLQASLRELHHSLQAIGTELILLKGDPATRLVQIVAQSQATHLFCNRVYEPALMQQEKQVLSTLRQAGVQCQSFHDQSLFPAGGILNHAGRHYQVFTPFWKRLSSELSLAPPAQDFFKLPKQQRIAGLTVVPFDRALAQLRLVDEHPWHAKLADYWKPGETAALQLLQGWRKRLADYPEQRDWPGKQGTSHLSAALHFGVLSVWRVFHVVRPAWRGQSGAANAVGAEAFLRQLAWREFAIHLLYLAPHSTEHSMRAEFDEGAIWSHDERLITAWRRGETGIPLVDAGMRELWETGFMHNRVRMVTASLLTKNLGQHWLAGARWFWDTLVDADLANNTMGWQWVAGCGCDAAPYFRIFNPETQLKRFDPDAAYLSRWLPADRLSTPIVDLGASRKAALARYQHLPKSNKIGSDSAHP